MDRKEYLKQYRQSAEYKAKNAARMKAKRTTAEGKAYDQAYQKTPRGRYKMLVQSAKKRELECTISFDVFKLLLEPGRCSYCNKDIREEGGYQLDRSDNSRGYHEDNVVLACIDCNQRKFSTMDGEEFRRQNKLNGYWKEGE